MIEIGIAALLGFAIGWALCAICCVVSPKAQYHTPIYGKSDWQAACEEIEKTENSCPTCAQLIKDAKTYGDLKTK